VRRNCSEKWAWNIWSLLHNTTPVHQSLVIEKCFAKHMWLHAASVILPRLIITLLLPISATEKTLICENRGSDCKSNERSERYRKWFPEMLPKALWPLENYVTAQEKFFEEYFVSIEVWLLIST
jgi:hypothetical protein